MEWVCKVPAFQVYTEEFLRILDVREEEEEGGWESGGGFGNNGIKSVMATEGAATMDEEVQAEEEETEAEEEDVATAGTEAKASAEEASAEEALELELELEPDEVEVEEPEEVAHRPSVTAALIERSAMLLQWDEDDGEDEVEMVGAGEMMNSTVGGCTT